MSEPEQPGDFGDFKASFLSEADEYLQVMEHAVLELEAGLSGGTADVRQVQEFFRAAHTIKALAAMLEFEPIVELAHRLEGLLRALERHTLAFTAAVMDGLVEGTKALSALVEGVRAGRGLVVPASTLQRLDGLLSLASTPPPAGQPAEAALSEQEEQQIAAAVAAGLHLFEVRFRPTADLASRGVTINAVRENLGRLGEILRVRPEMDTGAGGGVSFVILLATPEGAAAVASAAGLEEEAVKPVQPAGPAEKPGAVLLETPGRSSIVRVDIARLDELMRLVGEMVGSRARMGRAITELERAPRREAILFLQEANQRMDRHLRELREAVMRVRIVQIREVFGRMPLVVRDASRAAGKQVRLEMEGGDTEIDKVLLDRLADPLMHLLRNAVDHGLEPPEVRKAGGKSEVGTVRLLARREGDRVVISVGDDGQGIDRARVAARAAALGFDPREVRESDETLLQALCHPGVTTREQAGRTSGRGVGMDVVRQRVREMSGMLEMATREGQGTTFTLRLPLTITIIQALAAVCGCQRFAVPVGVVDEVAEISRREIVAFEGNEIVQHRGQVLPLLRLNSLFHLAEEHPDRPYLHALVVKVGGNPWVITVDRLVGEQEVVVKTLADVLVRTPGVVGATDMGDGELALILDIPELVRAERGRRVASARGGA